MTYMAIFYAVTITLVCNIILTPLLIYIAHKHSWYDEVNERKIHSEEVPRIGGIGIFLSTIAGVVFYGLYTLQQPSELISLINGYMPLLISVLLIHIIGLLDDFTNIKASYKLILQIAISLFIVLTGHHFTAISVPTTDTIINLSFLGPVITVIWIVGITNAINLIDGLDGLSGGISAIVFLFFGLFSFTIESEFGVVVALILFVSTLSFLFFNVPPAKIFMGDSGSLLLGLMAAVLPLYILPGKVSLSAELNGDILILSATFLIIPILDTFSAFLRRKKRKIPFYIPDKSHIHHKLLYLGISNKTILLLIYGISAISSFIGFWWVETEKTVLFLAIIFVWIVIIGFFIFVHKKGEKKSQIRYNSAKNII